MAVRGQIIGTGAWWTGPAGADVLAWERQCAQSLLVDAFGFHALQLGLPELDALQANRMPHRWLAVEGVAPVPPGTGQPSSSQGTVHLQCEFDALPFPGQSLDLVVMAHALESARDPHLALREVERVLVPEGRVLIFGFNPLSLWRLRQPWRHATSGRGREELLHTLPHTRSVGDAIAYRRLRDWLRLLGFEVEGARFGCFRPPLSQRHWLERLRWMETVGQRWWPVLGAVYALEAVKRVRGMRLVGLARRQARYAAAARPAVAVNQSHRFGAPPAEDTGRGR
jgi:SAM-dependent methyltransferase